MPQASFGVRELAPAFAAAEEKREQAPALRERFAWVGDQGHAGFGAGYLIRYRTFREIIVVAKMRLIRKKLSVRRAQGRQGLVSQTARFQGDPTKSENPYASRSRITASRIAATTTPRSVNRIFRT